jgi:hypothetical protein
MFVAYFVFQFYLTPSTMYTGLLRCLSVLHVCCLFRVPLWTLSGKKCTPHAVLDTVQYTDVLRCLFYFLFFISVPSPH